MRDIESTINQIGQIIPAGEFDPLRKKLQWIIETARYTPPESMRDCWHVLGECLYLYLQEPDTEWKIQIQKLLMGETDG